MDKYIFALGLVGPFVLLYLVPTYSLYRAFHWAVRSVVDHRWVAFFIASPLAVGAWFALFWNGPTLPSDLSVGFVSLCIWLLADLVGNLFRKARAPVMQSYARLRAGASAGFFGCVYFALWAHWESSGLFTLLAVGMLGASLWARYKSQEFEPPVQSSLTK